MAIRIRPAKRVKKAKTKNGKEVLRRLEEFLKDGCDEPVEILCGFWEDQQNAITYQELRQAVQEGSISPETLRLWSQDYSVLVTDKLSALWTDAVRAGSMGQPVLDGLIFSMQTPGIMNWINERGAEFVTASTQEQKNAIAALLRKKIKDGHTVDELSRLIRPCVGLTERDAKAAVRLYDHIVATLREEHPRMKPENIRKKALDATRKYAERKHRQRAMTIAQTESAFAYNRGADEGIRQAQAAGYLGVVKKRWCTSGDDAVCETCASLEGLEIDMDAEFGFKGRVLFQGHKLLPPAHPRCACAVEYIEVDKRGEASTGFSEENYLLPETADAWKQEPEEDGLLKEVLNEYERKVKIAYDNMTRNNPPVALSELKGRHAKNIHGIIENAPEHYRKILTACEDEIFFLKTDAIGHNRFSNEYNGIFINLKADEHDVRGAYTAVFHEIGHHVDRILNNVSKSGDFGALLKADAQNFLVAYSQMNGYNTEEALYKISDAMLTATDKQCHIMSDLFSGIYGETYGWKYRHSDIYWSKAGRLEGEAFAHFFSASVLSDEKKMETVKSVFPEAYSWFDKLIQEVVRYG